MPTPPTFGQHRIYYNNFASHLLNAYNPNMFYPELPHRWSDADWRRCLDMLAEFGFTSFQYWLEPRLFCREGLDSAVGREFARQLDVITEHAHRRDLRVHCICALATTGGNWHTLCPNVPAEWNEICFLWDAWSKRFAAQDVFGIFPGDPGACSRNGCTALTYIDKSIEIAHLIRRNSPHATVEFNTWGPPFFGWGNVKGPEGWQGEFVAQYQHTAWDFDRGRAEEAMRHLVKRLPDFPPDTIISQNMGFNSDCNPVGDQDARPWVREIAKTNPVYTWDFSLTEGENNVVPHWRFDRLFQRRREEREVGAYSGGICFTMTPLLNPLSLYLSAQSFLRPDAQPETVAAEFCVRLYGPDGAKLVPYLKLFEVVKDWGNYIDILLSRDEYHLRLQELVKLLHELRPALREDAVLHPRPAAWHAELLFFAELCRDLSGPAPDYPALRQSYWNRVYAIYDRLPVHVDPRPHQATDNLIAAFKPENWRGQPQHAIPGKWTT
ncbi:MAG: hypothetical protein WC708_18250 [Lentisphaeria bacterium]